MNTPVGFGIVGTGGIAQFHAQALQMLPEAKLVAVCSRTQKHAEKFTARFGGTPYHDLNAMLADPRVDVLLIATPSGAHLAPTIAAAKAGKHVLCEKPLEITTERARQMIEAHELAGTRLGCIFQNRYLPALVPVRKALQEHRLGTLTFGAVFVPWWRAPSYYTESSWHGTLALDGGGALINQSIHMIDLLCDLFPPVEAVSGFTSSIGHPGIETEDAAIAAIRFRGGALGCIHGTTSAWPGRPKRLEICGTEGTVVLEDNFLRLFQFRDERPEDEMIRKRYGEKPKEAMGAADPAAMTADLHAACIKDFIYAIRSGVPYPAEGEAALRSIRLIEQIVGKHSPITN